MRPFNELINVDDWDYEHIHKRGIEQNHAVHAAYDEMNGAEKIEAVKEYLFVRAYKEEGIKDPNQLAFLYNELNKEDSPIWLMAKSMAGPGAVSSGDRYDALHSKYFEDAVFGSAKDGYNHISQKEAGDYYNKAIEHDGLFELNRKHKRIPKDREPVFKTVSQKKYDEYVKLRGTSIKAYDKANKFKKDFSKLNEELLEDIEVLLKDNATREKAKPDKRSETYKNFVKAAEDYKKAVKSGKAAEISGALEELTSRANTYKFDHKGFTKGNIGMGRTRYNISDRIASKSSKVLDLEGDFKSLFGNEMKHDPDKKLTEYYDLADVKYGKSACIKESWDRLNRSYSDALNKNVIGKVNLGFTGKNGIPSNGSEQQHFDEQKELLIDAAAKALAINTLSTTIQSNIDTFKNTEYKVADRDKLAQESNNLHKMSKHAIKESAINTLADQLKGREDFQRLMSEQTKDWNAMKALANTLKSGKTGLLKNELNKHTEAVANEEKVKEGQVQKQLNAPQQEKPKFYNINEL